MKKILICCMLAAGAWAAVEPVNLKCEYLTNPEGIDMPDPRFFWQVTSAQNGEAQTAYQILVATSESLLSKNQGDAFDSGKVKNPESIQIVYQGNPLKSSKNYFWKVRIWGQDGAVSKWSLPAQFATGLLNDADWGQAQWVAWRPQQEWETAWWKRKDIELKCSEMYLPAYFGSRMNMFERMYFHGENRYDPAPLLRKEIQVEKQVVSAKAFISGLGYYELSINGKRVSDHVLDPGWTQYDQTVLYVAHDVTDYLQKGTNAIGVMLGRGNYGSLAIDHWGFSNKGGYIGQPKLKCLVKITYSDGSEDEVVSDLSWKVTGGPVRYDDPRMGEVYDATHEISGWDQPNFDDSDWDAVHSAPAPAGALKSQLCQPIRVVSVTKPAQVKRVRRGHCWVDTGTNMAGWIRLKVDAPKGTALTFYYAEDPDPLKHGQPGGYQQMGYVAKGVPGEVAECRFSYHGFRYVLIKGHKKRLKADDIEVCQVNTDVPNAAAFNTSDHMLNRLHTICRKSMESNLHSIPTDCPHREKNGWMGDATTGMEYGMANYDLAALMTKYVRDMLDTQDSEGRMSSIAPSNTRPQGKGRSPLWASACVHVPWYMYNAYGDTRIFEQNWDQLKLFTQGAWKHGQVEGKPGIIRDIYGDWVSPHKKKPEVNEGGEVYSTMNFFLVLKRMTHMAEVLGKKADAKAFNEQAEDVREAIYTYLFDEKTTTFTGLKPTDYRQGPNALALQYRIVKPEHQKAVLNRLLTNIAEDRELHVYGGIFTAQAAWELMPETGNMKLAYDVLSNDTYPGYGFMLKNGATTVWERWTDGDSHIHHFLGFIDNLLTRHVAGLRNDLSAPGYRNMIFEPKFIDAVDHADYTYDSIRGPASIQWKRDSKGSVHLELSIPANCTGDLVLPANFAQKLKIDGRMQALKEYRLEADRDFVVFPKRKHIRLSSGTHRITVKLSK